MRAREVFLRTPCTVSWAAPRALALALSLLCSLLAGCGGSSDSTTREIPPSAPKITREPVAVSVAVDWTASFSVAATGTAPLTFQWLRSGQPIAGATADVYVTGPVAAADDGAMFSVVVHNSKGAATSTAARLTVTPTPATNDNSRTAQNLAETTLSPANVNAADFGLLRTLAADGQVDGQPLIVSALSVGGRTRNVVYVVTEHDSVYAYDADDGTALAHVSVVGAGETPSDNRDCGQVNPEIGITSTPVIDRGAGTHGTIFIVAMTRDASGNHLQRLHALDLTTLAEYAPSPTVIAATYAGSGANSIAGSLVFDPAQYVERAGLLLLNSVVYTAWTSHCDRGPYNGWIMGYDETTLTQTRVLNLTPNGTDGAIWQAGGGMAADAAGNIYALVANGTFDTTLDPGGMPLNSNYGNAFIKVSSANRLAVADYFAEFNAVGESANDVDLGSGAPMLLPDLIGDDLIRHLAVGAGKDGHLYVINRDSMGKFDASSNAIYEDLAGALPGGVYSAPAYFDGSVYYADVNGTLKAFAISNARLSRFPSSQSSGTFSYPGASPAISAHGVTNGIVWALESTQRQPAVLHAYEAANLANELYNSNQAAGGRDDFGTGNKFITPTIANGKVYVGTPDGVAVFGLLP